MSGAPASARRAAAIDIGTNSVLLTIAEQDVGGVIALDERATITRLGEGVDASRELDPGACRRTLDCLSDYARAIVGAGVERVAAVGTSALRDAAGCEQFLSEAASVLGVRPRVLDGGEEARLTFVGAASGFGLAGELLVFDVGGGSTEIVHGDIARSFSSRAAAVTAWASLDVGSVRLFERHVRHDPPTPAEIERVREALRSALAPVPRGRYSALVGVAGTVTTLSAIVRGASVRDPVAAHGDRLSLPEIESVTARLAALPLSRRIGLAGLDPGRADVIVVGALIVEELVRWAGSDALWVSDRGVRWGLLDELLSETDG